MTNETGGGEHRNNVPSWLNDTPCFSWNALRRERNSMSSEARQKIERCRYGIIDRNDLVESPELVSNSLELMEEAIEAIEHKEAYELAMFIDPINFGSVDFRLAFLRADNFDTNAAARRIVNYWERKVELFGTEIAFQADLSILSVKEEDCSAVAKGGFRLLPNTDDYRRAIFMQFPLYYDSNPDSMLRLVWLFVHLFAFDEERSDFNQKMGAVFLCGKQTPSDQISMPFQMTELKRYYQSACTDLTFVLPIKMCSIHVFSPNWLTHFRHEHLLGYCTAGLRNYLTFYPPMQVEKNLESLRSCGIRPGSIPTEQGGSFDFNYHAWLEDLIFHEIVAKGLAFKDIEEKFPSVKHLFTLLNS